VIVSGHSAVRGVADGPWTGRARSAFHAQSLRFSGSARNTGKCTQSRPPVRVRADLICVSVHFEHSDPRSSLRKI